MMKVKDNLALKTAGKPPVVTVPKGASPAHRMTPQESASFPGIGNALLRLPGGIALQDLWDGWEQRELWLTIGWYELRKRYRRSRIGPLWTTISLAVFIVALGFLYVPLLGHNLGHYLPYVAFGMIGWQLISQLVSESCTVFINNAPIIQQLRAPLSIYIYKSIWRHLLILAHNMLIYVGVVLLFGVYPTWATLLFIPGLFLVCLNALFAGMLFGGLCTRFRDIPPIIGMIVQMMFLLTPIIWRPDQVPSRGMLVDLNPFFYFLELVREPLLGGAPSRFIWLVSLGITLLFAALAIPFFSRFRDRIAYWV